MKMENLLKIDKKMYGPGKIKEECKLESNQEIYEKLDDLESDIR